MSRGPQEEAAHRYADHGWFVFPTAPGSKIPVTEHGYLDATTAHKQIQQWWRQDPGANVAIATGAPGPDVVDVDKKGDRSGYPAWNALRQAGIAGEPQAVIRTPSGGMHAYYQGTAQRNGSLPEHAIDFRSTGGYVVTAPSKDAGGRPYAVVSKHASAATIDWSAARQHLDPQRERQPQRAPQRDAGRPKDVSHLAAWVAAQGEGNRNQGLFWAANRAVEAGDTETLGKLAAAARSAGLDDREIDRTIRSAQQASGVARPFEHHQEGGRERTARAAQATAEHSPSGRTAEAKADRQQRPAGRTEPRHLNREPATVPSPRADIERSTAAGVAAARAHKQPEPEQETRMTNGNEAYAPQDQIREGPHGYYRVSAETVEAERIAELRERIADDIAADKSYQENAARAGISWSPGDRPTREAHQEELAELTRRVEDPEAEAG